MMPLLLVKATLVFALGLLVTRLARRARASVRHMVLASTFGVVILMPGVAALLPSLGTTRPDSVARAMLVPRAYIRSFLRR